MEIIKCTEIAKNIKNQAIKLIERYNVKPKTVIIKCNNDKASLTYVTRKIESVINCGVEAELINVDIEATTEELIKVIEDVNNDSTVTGIILQLPLPKHIDVNRCLEAIDPVKDLDCLTSLNMGLLMKNTPYIEPCTPQGIVYLLDEMNVNLEGLNVLILGRSQIVGLPLSVMLTHRNCTVTLAHSYSEFDLDEYNIVVSAIGQAHKFVVNNPNAICIDVGINFKDSKQVGDFNIEDNHFNCKWVSSPKGGTGIITSAMATLNSVKLAIKQQV